MEKGSSVLYARTSASKGQFGSCEPIEHRCTPSAAELNDVRRRGAQNGSRTNGRIECYEAAAMLDGEREQVAVGDLLWSQYRTPVEHAGVCRAYVIGPELVLKY
jgi:hypothetical protein